MARAPGLGGSPAVPRGFSLVELVVVIVITGIMASVVGLFITGPIAGFMDQARRAELVDGAQLALTRMGRDLRQALPNSVRISGNAMELLLTLDGERYRTEPPGADDDKLDFTAADTKFNTFGPFDTGTFTLPVSGWRLAIYPLGQANANPWVDADNVMTPAATTFTVNTVTVAGASEYQVTLSAPHKFPFDSPTRRVFLVQGPITYTCSGGELRRYSGYAVSTIQPVPPAVAPEVVVRNVEACAFVYNAQALAQRTAVVSLSLSLEKQSERIRLIRQVHVDNTP